MSRSRRSEYYKPAAPSEDRRAAACIHLVDSDFSSHAGFFVWGAAQGFRKRLHPSAESLVAAAPGLEPGCVVLDLVGPTWSALGLLDRLRAAAPHHPVVVYGCGDVALAVAAMKLGAADVLDWPVRWTALAEAVDRALLADGGERTPAPPMSALSMCRVSTLSPRQRDVLQGLMAGKVNKTIARQLGVSPRTVECHRAALMARTGAHSLSDLIRIGIAAGL